MHKCPKQLFFSQTPQVICYNLYYIMQNLNTGAQVEDRRAQMQQSRNERTSELEKFNCREMFAADSPLLLF